VHLEGVTGEAKCGSKATGAVQAGKAWVLEGRARGAAEAGAGEGAEAEAVAAEGAGAEGADNRPAPRPKTWPARWRGIPLFAKEGLGEICG
jgi:hypothetical protein